MINSSHLPAFVFPIKLRGCRSGLLRRTSKPAISHICHIIIYGNPVLNEDSLHKACICLQFYHFILIGIICQLGKNMAFIVRIKIIAVNNPHRIIQLQTEFKSISTQIPVGILMVSPGLMVKSAGEKKS